MALRRRAAAKAVRKRARAGGARGDLRAKTRPIWARDALTGRPLRTTFERMGVADDTIRAEVSSALWPGEAVLYTGWLGRPMHEAVYLVAATQHRLFFVEGRFGLTSVVLTNGGERFAIEHRAFTAIDENPLVLGSRLRFEVHGQEPRGFDLAAHKIGTGCDGLGAFVATYLPWLRRHVAHGSFRTQEGAQHAVAELERGVAESAALRQRFAADAARVAAQKPVRWPWIPGFLFVLAGIFGVFTLVRFAGRIDGAEARAAQVEKEIADAKSTPAKKRTAAQKDLLEQADERRAGAKASIAQSETNRLAGFAFTGGFALAVGCFVLASRLTAKKRAAAAT